MSSDAAPAEGPTTEATYCFHHHDRETGLVCTRCERYACWECLTPAPVGSHCWQCIRAARPALKERVRTARAHQLIIATRALIAINITVFVIGTIVDSAHPTSSFFTDWAIFKPAMDNGEWWRLITAGFVHASLFHIGMNM